MRASSGACSHTPTVHVVFSAQQSSATALHHSAWTPLSTRSWRVVSPAHAARAMPRRQSPATAATCATLTRSGRAGPSAPRASRSTSPARAGAEPVPVPPGTATPIPVRSGSNSQEWKSKRPPCARSICTVPSSASAGARRPRPAPCRPPAPPRYAARRAGTGRGARRPAQERPLEAVRRQQARHVVRPQEGGPQEGRDGSPGAAGSHARRDAHNSHGMIPSASASGTARGDTD